MSAEEDYAEAQRRIKEVQESGGSRVNFMGLQDLTEIPQEIMFFRNLSGLNCRGTKITDLGPVLGARKLFDLDLTGTPITDLTFLQSLTSLHVLYISGTKVTDLFPLRFPTSLLELFISNLPVTNIAPLIALEDLSRLHAGGTPITDIAPLRYMPRLETVILNDTQVSNLSPLSNLKDLKSLSLRNTPVTDLTPISKAMHLQQLELTGSKVQNLRPIADLPFPKISDVKLRRTRHFLPGGLMFENTAATHQFADLAELSKIPKNSERTRKTLAYLRDLPPDAVAQQTESATTEQRERKAEPHHLAGLSPISLSRARTVLEQNYTDLRDQCAFAVAQIDDARANQIPLKPNDPDKLAEWERLVGTLDWARAAMIVMHDALPEDTPPTKTTDADARRLKEACAKALEMLQSASRHIDRAEAEHGRTYAGILKIGVSAILASPFALLGGIGFGAAAGAISVTLYGKNAFKGMFES